MGVLTRPGRTTCSPSARLSGCSRAGRWSPWPGSRVRVDYSGEQPVLAVQLKELFGWAAAPALADGRAPLTVHLLSRGSDLSHRREDRDSLRGLGTATHGTQPKPIRWLHHEPTGPPPRSTATNPRVPTEGPSVSLNPRAYPASGNIGTTVNAKPMTMSI
ncbi:ATP-dependent helicase C-terminal domain-containing protein [Streptomyces sp. NPDC029674]|uniref:ATP-dependent helicase C-terminal domain-containing protein n=1 Tax=Streptomyces sp. NPDC029674 TaxID=3365297 RepID=UPI00384C5A8B